MRAINLVDRLEFEFSGNVLRNAITLEDVDNDGNYELVVANEKGEVCIYKGSTKWQTISNLGFVCCLAIGDIFNKNRNSLVIITGDGWCYIYDSPIIQKQEKKVPSIHLDDSIDRVDGQILSGESFETDASDISAVINQDNSKSKLLQKVHVQRIPANTKNIVLADIDGDGCIEMVLGLTDRVVRSYRWFDPLNPKLNQRFNLAGLNNSEIISKLVGINKWECAKQIGSVSLHHDIDDKPSLLIAQPGGTFMRIRYQSDDSFESDSSNSCSEYLTGSSIDYQFLGLSRMRNQNISTEIVGDLKTMQKFDDKNNLIKNGAPYAVATLDGTIMLVQNEIILWAIAVDHQIFALTKLDITGNEVDDLVACSWDGHTYILDQDKHVVRFQLGESVQAFESGYYTLTPGDKPVTCFVYITFHNQILVYYNIPLKEMICQRYKLQNEKVAHLFKGESYEKKCDVGSNLSKNEKNELVEFLLYGVNN